MTDWNMSAKKRKYIPKPRHNPEVLARQIECLQEQVEDQRRLLEIVTLSYDKHMEHLSSFAKHDMGNAVQSMYAILKLLSKKLPDEDCQALKVSIDNVQNTLNSFENMVPYTKTGSFSLQKLMAALESLTRFQAGAEGISYRFLYDRVGETKIHQPFQAFLQLLQNLTSNSIKALRGQEVKVLEVEAVVEDDLCAISVKDTGCGIPDENVNQIFDYKFTTTDGCGIGLYHARYVCEQIKGELFFERNVDGFSTVFTFKFNIDGNKTDSDH